MEPEDFVLPLVFIMLVAYALANVFAEPKYSDHGDRPTIGCSSDVRVSC